MKISSNKKGGVILFKEYEIDENLFYLEHLLFGLKNYNFDDEVSRKIEDLKDIIDKKLHSKLNAETKDISDYKLIFRYILDKC